LSKQEVRPSFGNFITQTNVHIIKIELDEKHQADYSIIANKCWATPTPDPDSTIRYDFLKPQRLVKKVQ
jgi:Zona pellucida-like domain